MDWMTLWAVLIALAVSFGEMLSKYEWKVVRDIFNRYLLIYLGINDFLHACDTCEMQATWGVGAADRRNPCRACEGVGERTSRCACESTASERAVTAPAGIGAP